MTPLSLVGCKMHVPFICLPRSVKSPAVKQRLTVDPGRALFVVHAKTVYFYKCKHDFFTFFVYTLGFGVSAASFVFMNRSVFFQDYTVNDSHAQTTVCVLTGSSVCQGNHDV